MEVKGVQDLVDDCEQRIEEHIADKETLAYQCEEIQRQFKKLVQDYKFADFLRRIFKKKYRAPRARDEDESSESESSSSSSEEDEGSLDSRDIGPIRLDPTICPEGCDREIYDKTFEMRGTRHKWEQEMQEKDRSVDLLKRDIEAHNKVKRKLTIQLDKRKKDLKEFMMEKQKCLNQIDQTVVLRYDQMRARAVAGCTGPEGLSQAVVFPEQLLLKLRKRVLELQEEIKLARFRAKINRTHLFRMNIDLREMQRLADEIRAQMRDVLTRKLGKPRKVDKTLDDLLRQMARRHKYGLNLKIMPHILAQFRNWRERHNELEQKYLKALDNYSERLRLAAALQSNILPQKPKKDPTIMCGCYEIEHYQRDVVRLRIVRSQQLQQIKQLTEEINELKLKATEPLPDFPPAPLEPQPSEIWLYEIPPMHYKPRRKYFPITPLSSQHKMIYDVNVVNLLYDCLDSMRVNRDDAEELLKDLTDLLPSVISGEKSRYEVVDGLVRKWLLKHGGDPSQYKKHTRAFDALAALADRIIRQHMETLEGATEESNKVMGELEVALKDIAPENESLAVRIGPIIATLFHTAATDDLQTEETMTSLVNSLVDEDHPLNEQEIFEIDIETVVRTIQDLGVTRVPFEEIERIVIMTVECLKAQLVSEAEAKVIADEVDRALATAAQQSALVLPPEQRVSVSDLDTSRSRHSSRSSKSNLSERRSRVISIVDDSNFKTGGWGKVPEEATATSRTSTTWHRASKSSKDRLAPLSSKEGFASTSQPVMAAFGSKTGIASSKTRLSGDGSKTRVTRTASLVTTTERVSQEGTRRVSRTTSRTTTVTEYETTPVSGTSDLEATTTEDEGDSL
ncbi:hypothetical protein NE865_05210 [Phthorimaea operculella]|nr:hypothetical protein NE865_05210 [Phthorimaea operculella]